MYGDRDRHRRRKGQAQVRASNERSSEPPIPHKQAGGLMLVQLIRARSNGDLENSNGIDPVNVNHLISDHLQFNHMPQENLEI